jgi:hypothetical protein
MKQSIHKLGTSRAGARTRLWLEGKRLAANGFFCTAQCQRVWSEGRLVLRVVDDEAFAALPRDQRTTVAGTDDRPIIDITGLKVSETFSGDTVNVTWHHSRIVIEG